MERGKLENFLTSDPYQQFPNSPSYINQDQEQKYAFYENYGSSYEDYRNENYYDDEYLYDYTDYGHQDYRLPNDEDRRFLENKEESEDQNNREVDQNNLVKETKYPEKEENINIKYSESYSKMNLANKLSNDREIPKVGPISNNVIKSWNLTQEFERLEPVNMTAGGCIRLD